MQDKHGRKIDYLRISITERCNLRCIYCMPDNHKEVMTEKEHLTCDEICRIAKESASLGITKIRITGGEPLLRHDILNIIRGINNIEGIEEICMTTNGILLYDQLDELVESGLNRVNISLDTLNSDKFKKITRGGSLEKVLLSIDKCLRNNVKIKLNTVIIDNINKDEILDIIEFAEKKAIDLRFIELMPIGEAKSYKPVTNEEILEIIKNEKGAYYIEERNEKDGPAEYMRTPNGIGRIGFISAMTNCFCNQCNRIRVTADGFLKQCINWNTGANLKKLLIDGISDEELRSVIEENIYSKPIKHLFQEESNNKDFRSMFEIGG